MKLASFDTLPQMSKNDALQILKTPIHDLRLSSDYYKAVFHLSKYPSSETEHALLELLKNESLEQSVVIAKRKAIEVLGNMCCENAIPYIAGYLNSNDPYIVENSALALVEIGCNDPKVHNLIGDLLEKSNQNKRILIQSLGRMRALSQLPKIKKFVNNENINKSIKGASIAAISNITGNIENIDLLANSLDSANQNERICAVQDIIDAKAYQLIPLVLRTPISPFFRIRSISLLFPNIYSKQINVNIIESLDSMIFDCPSKLRLRRTQAKGNTCNFYIQELFNTDFNRSYTALLNLKKINSKIIFSNLEKYWDKFIKDYGALYFLLILFRDLEVSNEKDKTKILEIISYCLDKSWPDYMKFKPQAIFLSIYVDLDFFVRNFKDWLDNNKTKYWFSRYTALFAIEQLIINKRISTSKLQFLLSMNDDNKFVKFKSDYIISKYL